jgi:hypothetical protein
MTEDSPINNVNKKSKKSKFFTAGVLFLIFLLLLLLIGLYFYFKHKDKEKKILPAPVNKTKILKKNSLNKKQTQKLLEIDTVVQKPQEKSRISKIDTVQSKPKPSKAMKKAKSVVKDTVIPDTTDSILYDPCTDDTIPPWVYPDPSGGLHYGKIVVHFVASKPCSISWKFNDEKAWNNYSTGSDSIEIAQNTILSYRAKDSCGNSMNIRYEQYEITMPHKQKFCPEDMEYIVSGEKKFCIDRYEWPNKRNYKPKSNISIYHAMDSCFKVGKRLCTTEEWSLACSGIHKWKYTYGDVYEPNACVTKDTSVQPIGKRPECRGYFQVFDMSGNLAEWTNTKSVKNSSFYNVMGGFWESGPQSTCIDARYSYYPTNTHNPVGFRCCREKNINDKNSK